MTQSLSLGYNHDATLIQIGPYNTTQGGGKKKKKKRRKKKMDNDLKQSNNHIMTSCMYCHVLVLKVGPWGPTEVLREGPKRFLTKRLIVNQLKPQFDLGVELLLLKYEGFPKGSKFDPR